MTPPQLCKRNCDAVIMTFRTCISTESFFLIVHGTSKGQKRQEVSGFGYLVFSLPAPSQSFAHLVYLLLKSWFLSHSLLKFLEQAESAEGDVQCGKGEETRRVFTFAVPRPQLDRPSSGKSRVVGFSVTFGFATDK